MNDNIKFLSDRQQVAAWLYELDQKRHDLDRCPTACHGED